MRRKPLFFLLALLSFLLFSSAIFFSRAEAGDPSSEFWIRFNRVYDIGKNFLEDTARGSGRISPLHWRPSRPNMLIVLNSLRPSPGLRC